MLTVHRKNGHTILFRKRDNDMARCNEGLLICECDGLFCLDGGNCRTNAKHTDNCSYNYIARLNGGTSNETVHAIAYFDISIRKACAKLLGIVFITYTDKLWLKFPCLFLYKGEISATGKCHNLHITMLSYHIKCLCSDRAG